MSQNCNYLHTTKALRYGKGENDMYQYCTTYLFTFFIIFFVKNIQYNLTDFETEYNEIHLMNSKENGASFYYEEKSLR